MFFRGFGKVKTRRRSRRVSVPDAHYKAHKEYARTIITERVLYWNQFYNFSFNRIAIKNQKRCWGSCSANQNLNFNYKIIFIPEALMDYVIVHELCHLAEMNHSKAFWKRVGEQVHDHTEKRAHLARITRVPAEGFPSSVVQQRGI